LTLRSDLSILFSRIGILINFYVIISSYVSYHINFLEKGVSLYGGLFSITSVSQTFQIYILLICGLILFLTGFFPRKKDNLSIKKNLSLINIFQNKFNEHSTLINKASEQFTIIEYTLLIIFGACGATLLLSSADFGSIYLCIELQSFSLYIISSIYRNSESSTGSALTYFLLGGLSSCFILLGLGIIYANCGLTNLDSVYSLVSDSDIYLNYSS
jgi:NADH-ubiquinone oxidoreductase chain 2